MEPLLTKCIDIVFGVLREAGLGPVHVFLPDSPLILSCGS